MDTILEQQRRSHEERERIIDSLVKEASYKKTTSKEQINSDHRMQYLVNRHVETTQRLHALYEDRDGLRREEVQALSGPNEIQEFYRRLKQIRDFHRTHPDEISIPMSVEFDELNKMKENTEDHEPWVTFTDEEGYGRYLDLHDVYNKYCNVKGLERITYIAFLEKFDKLHEIPKEKKNAQYRTYLNGLVEYLGGYVERVKPLLDMGEEMASVAEEFKEQWDKGSFPGWPAEAAAPTPAQARIDLGAYSEARELEDLGLARLKAALQTLGLKCGGTLDERVNRLWMTKGRNIAELDPSHFAKKPKGGETAKEGGREAIRNRDMATIEAQVYRLADYLTAQKTDTLENVQRKQARKEGEAEEEESESDGEEEMEDDEVPYNPKNLPLGWDGKPIPYWLYKLHGLNISYTCEICANFTYKGPKAFQRHFAEWRHAHGMRCLGIPNTAHFANVTAIEDALKLWEKLKSLKSEERWTAETEEEYEDSQGNVFNRKTYLDLQKQGLL